jgi:hypothetical protein
MPSRPTSPLEPESNPNLTETRPKQNTRAVVTAAHAARRWHQSGRLQRRHGAGGAREEVGGGLTWRIRWWRSRPEGVDEGVEAGERVQLEFRRRVTPENSITIKYC